MCGCCVSLWPWAVCRTTGTQSQGQGEGGDGDGVRAPRLGVWNPDSPRRLSEGRQCGVESLVATLSVPIHLRGPEGGKRGCWCWEYQGRWFPGRRRRGTNLNITNPSDKHKPTTLSTPKIWSLISLLAHLYSCLVTRTWTVTFFGHFVIIFTIIIIKTDYLLSVFSLVRMHSH